MMSELIVEMNMPKDCYDCPMYDFASYRGKLTLCCNAHLDLKPIPNNGNPRPSWCPIVCELPEQHGDLVDRDVSIQTFKCIEEAPYSGFDGQEPFYAPEDVVKTLLCQDVVIAAERSDT